eukprot:TRINITY_DN9007_c0_g1_i1.p1 TRINITY_DN9007_c0_g1~~TRINITY_DN9007_c0_g1_i1.p1  ORF type:complete len:252 (+),score=7.12 TRINITY_DN9007_c0_g1_i1:130-885(+)
MSSMAAVLPELFTLKKSATNFPKLTKISASSVARLDLKHRTPIASTLPFSQSISFSPSEVALRPSPPPKQSEVHSNEDDYYVNLGTAIRTLREQLPLLFTKDLTYDIYREDITFSDPLNTFHGLDKYKLLSWALRFHGRILFKEIWIEILRIWQPTDKIILIRWTVKGIPRVPWEAEGRFDGTSKYKLDKYGKIYEHHVDNLAFNFPEKLRPESVLDLVRVVGCPRSPTLMFFNGVCLSQRLQCGWSFTEQ